MAHRLVTAAGPAPTGEGAGRNTRGRVCSPKTLDRNPPLCSHAVMVGAGLMNITGPARAQAARLLPGWPHLRPPPRWCPNIRYHGLDSMLINGSPTMRAERATLKSRRDDMIIAQGKRSAALGYAAQTTFSFSLPVWRVSGAPNRKGKRDWVGGPSPRAAASAALPWAIIRMPLRGSEKANQSRQPTPGARLAACWTPLARPGCALR
jgi:hypothetical protein